MSVGVVGLVFFLAASALAYVLLNFPPLDSSQREKLKLPGSMSDVKELREVVSQYTDNYYSTVILGFSLTYLFLQSFCIPGSIFLSFLAGSLFGIAVGIPLVCFLSACGASGAYWLSFFFGRSFLDYFCSDKTKLFQEKLDQQRENIFFYFLFLRFSPLFPNWLVNIGSPVCKVPFLVFWVGTFIGVFPQTFIAVNAGLRLQEINDPKEILDYRTFSILLMISLLTILPTFLKNRLLKKQKDS
uniref:VTT domain-containing protein n=1 Tax=Arcella intermedia TaxID=1963864 RepID=A0A6B2LGE7_9EUKA